MSLTPEDPRLTAYALGELPEAQRAEVEAELARSPQARRAVEEIRRVGEELRKELSSEPAPSLSDGQRLAVAAEAAKDKPPPHQTSRRSRRPAAAGAGRLLTEGMAGPRGQI